MANILVIYTGGTIGMKKDPKTGSLVPFDFSQIEMELPDLKKLDSKLDVISFPELIDSSDVQLPFWVTLAETIKDNYTNYNGFVVLHGTDTMAYSASALSFMLENLSKPVIFTGSQLPIGLLRTDAKENLITAIEIASSGKISEVCIYIQNRLLRGNRTIKFSTELFNAFESFNYKPLAEVGVYIKYNSSYILPPSKEDLVVNTNFCMDITILNIYPGISIDSVDYILANKGIRAIILRTFGSGNAPTSKEFLSTIENAVNRGLIVLNVTQCLSGAVEMNKYATGSGLYKAGVVNGYDITLEAAITKLAFLLGKYGDNKEVVKYLSNSICGEITLN